MLYIIHNHNANYSTTPQCYNTKVNTEPQITRYFEKYNCNTAIPPEFPEDIVGR